MLGIGTVAAGVVLGPVALPALTPPAGAESTGTIALTPGSGSITDDPFAGFVADAPCPTGYDTLAQLTLEVDGVPVPLASLEGTGLDEIPPSGTVDGSLAAIANEVGGIVDLPDGVFPLLLTCFDAEFNTAPDPFRSAIRITDDTWSVAETVDPTPTGTGSPTPTQSPGPTPTPTSTGSPTPTESPSPSPSDSPTPTPTPTPSDDPSPTPTETPSPTPDPGGGTLPKTGTDLLTFVYVGLALIAAGIAALLWARRLGLLTRDAPDASTP